MGRIPAFFKCWCIFWGLSYIAGCATTGYGSIEPKAVPAQLIQPTGLTSILWSTFVNILNNSLLEAILLLMAIILFMRYKALTDQRFNRKEKKEEKIFRDFIDYKSSFDYSNWHFKEDEEHKR